MAGADKEILPVL